MKLQEDTGRRSKGVEKLKRKGRYNKGTEGEGKWRQRIKETKGKEQDKE